MVIMSAFQAEDTGSIPVTRSGQIRFDLSAEARRAKVDSGRPLELLKAVMF